MAKSNPRLEAALSYAKQEWLVFPLYGTRMNYCICGNVGCTSPGKHPRTPRGFKDATIDESQIQRYWGRWPEANIGIATGKDSGLIVVDIDPRHQGDESLKKLEAQIGPLPTTIRVATGGGGHHIYLGHPGGIIACSNSALGPGIDVKSDGGYVVAPPSLHVSGMRYAWVDPNNPEKTALADAPGALLAILRGQKQPAAPRLPTRIPDRIREGSRNDTLTSIAGTMRRKGLTEESIRAALLEENKKRCEPPLPDKEVEAIAHSVARYPSAPLDTPVFEPFPVVSLPLPVRTFVVAASEALGCDASFVATPLLAALASCVGNTRQIELKKSWREPCVFWTAIVGYSGTLKSPAIDVALKPLREKQDEALREYDEKRKMYEKETEEYEEQMRQWRNGRKAIPRPVKPEEPVPLRYCCSDTTVEALAVMLQNNPRGVLLVRDELAGWINGFDQYKPRGKGADDANWLELHRAGSLLVDRKSGKGPIHVSPASVSITGGIQPEILRRVLGQRHFEDGLAPRLLLAMPPTRSKRWTDADLPDDAVLGIEMVIEGLLNLDFGKGPSGYPVSLVIPLSNEGSETFIQFYNNHAEEQSKLPGGRLRAAWSKLEAYTARSSLLIHLIRQVWGDPTLEDPDFVDEQSVTAAVTIVRWYCNEVRRVYAVLGQQEKDDQEKALLDIIENREGRITVRQLMQASRRYRDDSDKAETALQALVDKEYGRWIEVQPTAKGGRPSRVFELNSPVTVTKPVSGLESGVPLPSPSQSVSWEGASPQHHSTDGKPHRGTEND